MRIITGKARGLKLLTPKNYAIRPTADRVKEALFNILASKVCGAKVLDLFAGSGNLGLESWSRGAREVVFFDSSDAALRLVRQNIAKCRAEAACRVYKGNAVQLAARLAGAGCRFDLAFCDPPYKQGLVDAIIKLVPAAPFLTDGGYLIVERDYSDALPLLPPHLELVRREKYGSTCLDFLKFLQ